MVIRDNSDLVYELKKYNRELKLLEKEKNRHHTIIFFGDNTYDLNYELKPIKDEHGNIEYDIKDRDTRNHKVTIKILSDDSLNMDELKHGDLYVLTYKGETREEQQKTLEKYKSIIDTIEEDLVGKNPNRKPRLELMNPEEMKKTYGWYQGVVIELVRLHTECDRLNAIKSKKYEILVKKMKNLHKQTKNIEMKNIEGWTKETERNNLETMINEMNKVNDLLHSLRTDNRTDELNMFKQNFDIPTPPKFSK